MMVREVVIQASSGLSCSELVRCLRPSYTPDTVYGEDVYMLLFVFDAIVWFETLSFTAELHARHRICCSQCWLEMLYFRQVLGRVAASSLGVYGRATRPTPYMR